MNKKRSVLPYGDSTLSPPIRSTDTQVGAVIADDDNRVISIGYNGFPKGIKDDQRLES